MAAMELFTSTMGMCDFAAISASVNEEIAQDKERPATGLGSSSPWSVVEIAGSSRRYVAAPAERAPAASFAIASL